MQRVNKAHHRDIAPR